MSSSELWPVEAVRRRFPALSRQVGDRPAVFLDGPAGSQVPQSVADAVCRYLLQTNANRGASFATSKESDAILNAAHRALADFLGTPDPDEVCFGANMTTLTFQLSRALSRQWTPGDQIVVCQADHDANYTPWVLAARDRGITVRSVPADPLDGTLDLDSLDKVLSEKTRLLAVGLAGNATGTIHPVGEICRRAHAVDALVYVDAVHFAPHRRIQVGQLACDFLVCSAYKFFGPHVGVLWGRRDLLEDIRPYRLRPAPDRLPGRWMTGTQCHEGIAGAAAAVDYIASLAAADSAEVIPHTRPEQLDRAFERIATWEQMLSKRLLEGLLSIPGLTLYGISDPDRIDQRVPTMSIRTETIRPQELAERLAADGIFVWAGNHYALPWTESAGLEPDGTLRLGALHYNTIEEIDRAVDSLRRLCG